VPEITFKRFMLVGGSAAGAILLLTAGVAIGQVTKSGSTATRAAASTVVRSATPSTVTLPAAPPTTGAGGLKTEIADGTYLVGTDLEPGSYKTDGGGDCYWGRYKDDSGSNIIANDLTDGGPSRFTAKKGEYVEVSRCTFTKIK
jgi:hypothetical protein